MWSSVLKNAATAATTTTTTTTTKTSVRTVDVLTGIHNGYLLNMSKKLSHLNQLRETQKYKPSRFLKDQCH